MLGTQSTEPAPSENSATALLEEEVDEENIYEVMKAHMRRQKEELEAKNAQLRQQQRANQYGRPGPGGAARPPASSAANEPPAVEKVSDISDLGGLWSATRKYLHGAARYLESVLGHCCRIESVDAGANEAVLLVPAVQRGFTNEKARAKIEEALRAVTDRPLKLSVQISEEAPAPQPTQGEGAAAPAATVQRIPPEVIEAVKEQAVVKQLMKSLDATVVHIEMLNTDE
ncbi:MAG: hypothetical protein ACTHN5_16130 [Phycisphaerae bacterium]